MTTFAPQNAARGNILPYTLFTIHGNLHAIHSSNVISIEILRDLHSVHGAPEHIRGGTLYRGNFLELVDMRRRFSVHSPLEEFSDQLGADQRIQEHLNWVNELEASVVERREFRLTDDPHKCRFGVWYDSFVEETNNISMKHAVSAVNTPHQAVHFGARKVKALMQKGAYDEALALVASIRDTHVKSVVEMIGSLEQVMAENLREVFIVVQLPSGLKGIIVDSVVAVESLNLVDAQDSDMMCADCISSIGQRLKDQSTVLIVDAERV